ncbi:MAG: thioredoxin [Clostridia bacterium]|nr:thioredoxin [Clostridia bacterium]
MREVNEQDFEKVIGGEKPVVIDFWASWCGPCKMMAPNFEAVAEELGEEYEFYKCNVDDNEGVAISQNIYSIPTIVIYKSGKEIARNVGFLTQNELKSRLKTQN